MFQREPTKFTEKEYLALEAASETKHEFIDGEIVAMAGASANHSLILMNIASVAVDALFAQGCRMFQTDLRVKTNNASYVYPDAVIVCGEAQFTGDNPDTLINPIAVFEVLSPSTEGRDHRTKFIHYQSIPSVQDYVLIDQEQRLIWHYAKQSDGKWVATVHQGDDFVLSLTSTDLRLDCNRIYRGVL
jgi:Uma2 family endonuclease